MTHSRIRIHGLLGVAAALAAASGGARANVMMQMFFTNENSTNKTPNYDTIASEAHQIAAAGFTGVWMPPPLKGASGGFSAGYDPFDDYDIGSKNEKGTTATKYGTADSLERCVAMMRANGIDVYVDDVLNHRIGDTNFNFNYVNAYGASTGGRFSKTACDFHNFGSNSGGVPQDPNVPASWYSADDSFERGAPFGPDLAPVNGCSDTNGENTGAKLVDAGDWLTKRLGIQGYRLDYMKGVDTNWMQTYLDSGAMGAQDADGNYTQFAVGEYYDGDRTKVERWINAVGQRASAFDFPLRFDLQSMCATNSTFNMRQLDHDGVVGDLPFKAVTFVENHDTDSNSAIVSNKALAYAYILTSEGYPCVFGKDYFNYGLKNVIDPLVWIHEKIAYGSTLQRWLDNDFFIYSRSGGTDANGTVFPPLLVGLNKNPTASKTPSIPVGTPFGPNVTLHDYTGHMPDLVTNAQGDVTITIPADVNGAGYVAYSVAGLSGSFAPPHKTVTQEFAGSADLDIRPADNPTLPGAPSINIPARIYAEAGTPVTAELYWDNTQFAADTQVNLVLSDSTGTPIGQATVTSTTPQGIQFTATTQLTGYHIFNISSNAAVVKTGPKFWLKVTYTAPPFFPPDLASALKVAGGLATATQIQAQYANGPVSLLEAVRLNRIANGLD